MASESNSRPIVPRWKPEEIQLRILEEVFHRNGGRSFSPAQVLLLTTQLQQYGAVEPRSIYFWLENRKRRSAPACIITNPIFSIAPGKVVAHTMDSATTSANNVTPTEIFKIQTIIIPTDHSTSSTVVNIVEAHGQFGLEQHFQQVYGAMRRMCRSELFNSPDHPVDDSYTHDERTLPLFPVYLNSPARTQYNNIDEPINIDVDVDLELRLGSHTL